MLDLTVIVPTLGRSPYLRECLTALELAGGGESEVLVVAPEGLEAPDLPPLGRARVVRVPAGGGFTGACNRGIREARSEFVALVNDDAIVAAGWAERLLSALRESPRCASAQGLNLQLGRSHTVDGAGIAWNGYWQAVQLDHGRRAAPASGVREVFGVSGTAAVFRRDALEAVSLAAGQVLDPGLHTYYEDVDLACRLRAAGYAALSVGEAHARHAGATSSIGNPRWRLGQLYRNRLLVLARLLGRSFWSRAPWILARDLADLLAALAGGRGRAVAAILGGWAGAARRLGDYTHLGPPGVPLRTLRTFRAG